MRFVKPSIPQIPTYRPDLRVVQLIATRRGDPERGPQIRMHPSDARFRLLTDGEVVWIHGPRNQQVAPLVVDPSIEPHTCTLRDLGGVDISEFVHVMKPDFDSPPRRSA